MNLAKDLLETCNRMYTDMPTGLSPEIAYFNLGNDGSSDIIVKVCILHNESFFLVVFRLAKFYGVNHCGTRRNQNAKDIS